MSLQAFDLLAQHPRETNKRHNTTAVFIYSEFIEKDNTILCVPFKLNPVEHLDLITIHHVLDIIIPIDDNV